MASVLDRLQRILDLEEKQGWRNRAVIGGLASMAERWADDAREEGVAGERIGAIMRLMTHFDGADSDARPDIAATMRKVIAGDKAVIDHWNVAEETTTESEPADAAQDGNSADASDAHKPDQRVPAIEPADATHVAKRRVDKERRQREQSSRSPHDLQASPTILNGVGAARAELLARLGIQQVIDLLWHLPTRHEDYSQLRTIAEMTPGEHVTLIANLWEIRERKISQNRQMVQGILADGTGTIHATWWNKWIVKQLTIGSTLRFSGKVGLYMGQKTLDNPVFEDVDAEMVSTGRLAPIYRLTDGLSTNILRGVVKQAVEEYAQFLNDPLPAEIRDTYQLPVLAEAIRGAHLPGNRQELDDAVRRLAFEELFYLQLGILQRRRDLKAAAAPALDAAPGLVDSYKQALPFEMTGAQARVTDEIVRDIARTVPMTRLVQGDVGSGKTAVAAAAMYIAARKQTQSALLAPTQILAEQHHRTLTKLMAGLTREDGTPLSIALLTGRVTGTAREEILEDLRNGVIDIIVGTTALIQEHVEFNDAALIVVDEQHRFGVEQRGALRSKQEHQPHLLVMSATPIPRSLALTLYGDLDLSIIDEMPPGRIPIQTKIFSRRERERLYSFVASEARNGRQTFIVYPLVEESESLDAGAAIDERKRLNEEVFPDLQVGLLHGRMKGSEKDETMRQFAGGEIDILVSTSVIEVGIDVPNASLIVIEDADRFGLAQLHQFRGRVGRGEHKSYCALVTKTAEGQATERLNALQATNDGFELAEIDLELRGPGDFLGTRQSGLPDLRVAQLTDLDTIASAREAAQKIFEQDPELSDFPALQREVARFWHGHGDVN